jgi:hypothetical protein
MGDSHGQILAKLLAKRLPLAVAVSHPGWSEAKWAASSDLDRFRSVDLVLVQLGGNNRQAGGAYEDSVARLLAKLPARVLWIGPSVASGAVGYWHEKTAEAQKRYLAERRIPWFDARAVTGSGHRDDGVHFTSAGYARWAQAIVPWAEGRMAGGAELARADFALPLAAAAVVVMWLWQRRVAVAAGFQRSPGSSGVKRKP